MGVEKRGVGNECKQYNCGGRREQACHRISKCSIRVSAAIRSRTFIFKRAGDPRKRHNIEDATYNCCTITYNTSKFLTVMYNLTHEILSLVATRDHVPR